MNLAQIINLTRDIYYVQCRFVSTTLPRTLIQKWRKEKSLPMNPNAYGVLTDKPDYTFLDGRPTPYGSKQRQRIMKEREIASRIIQLSTEIDCAVNMHKQRIKDNENRRQNIIKNKLKPKGNLLLK